MNDSDLSRKDFPMINLTPAASTAVKRFIRGSETPVVGLRVYVQGGGCAGFKYGLRLEPDKAEDDFEFNLEGITVLIDPMSLTLVDGLEVDFVDSLIQTGFKFQHPNATGSCVCGESFSF